MKNLKLYLFLLPLLLLNSCSWVEYFTIKNLSNNPIYINYTLIPLSKNMTLGIFDNSPTFYKSNKNGNIDWNNRTEIEDSNNDKLTTNIILPPKTIMIFGRLNNDNYDNPQQKFINGREFNLDFMEIEVNSEIHHISKKTFDHYFKKNKGEIKFEVK